MKKLFRVFIDNFRYIGIRGVLSGIYRHFFHPISPLFNTIEPYCRGKKGLEIGGPTRYFSSGHYLPIYTVARGLDNCNFSNETIWEGRLEEQGPYCFNDNSRPGTQYIREAGNLEGISNSKYDFLASSHMLEHAANPIHVLKQWMRVLKPGGYLILIVPHRDMTFDRVRPVTPMSHLISDYEAGVGEDDLTHLEDYIKYNVPIMLDISTSRREILQDNHNFRSMHHHVFDMKLVVDLLDFSGFRIHLVGSLKPNSIICTCVKPDTPTVIDNDAFLREDAAYRLDSPYPSDRITRMDKQA